MVSTTISAQNKLLVKEIVDSVSLPKGVRLRSIFFDVDHSGDLAAYIIFSIARDYGTTSAKIRVLNDLRRTISERLDERLPDVLSYVRFADASSR